MQRLILEATQVKDGEILGAKIVENDNGPLVSFLDHKAEIEKIQQEFYKLMEETEANSYTRGYHQAQSKIATLK